MRTLAACILLLIGALTLCAEPKPDRAADAPPAEAPRRSVARDNLPATQRLEAMCDDTALASDGLNLRELIGRSFAKHYYVGLSAGSSWRPLKGYGDCDNKLRVYNPTVGLAVSYSF